MVRAVGEEQPDSVNKAAKVINQCLYSFATGVKNVMLKSSNIKFCILLEGIRNSLYSWVIERRCDVL